MKYALLLALILLVVVLRSRAQKPKAASNNNDLDWPIELLEEASRDRAKQDLLRKQYKELFGAISEAMFRHDLAGINFGNNTDKYDPEVGALLPHLKDCHSAADLVPVLHQVYVEWFGPAVAAESKQYQDLANEIWELWVKHKPPTPHL